MTDLIIVGVNPNDGATTFFESLSSDDASTYHEEAQEMIKISDTQVVLYWSYRNDADSTTPARPFVTDGQG